jgi:hypothetical protein
VVSVDRDAVGIEQCEQEKHDNGNDVEFLHCNTTYFLYMLYAVYYHYYIYRVFLNKR